MVAKGSESLMAQSFASRAPGLNCCDRELPGDYPPVVVKGQVIATTGDSSPLRR
jgi:hypothetical protein